MRFYGFHTLTPEENMKIDEQLLQSLERGYIEPTFRLYKWSELCVSLGKNQRERDFPVKVVKRPTGGGALLHGWDISFALVDYKIKWGNSSIKVYKRLAEKFIELFKEFSVELKIEKNKSYKLDTYFCFFFPTFGELKTKENRKVVSMAMTEGRGVFLIHGSIYEKFDYDKASRILKINKEVLRKRVISLKELGIESHKFRKLLYSYLIF